MTRRGRRLVFVVALLACFGGATALVLRAFEDMIVFFYSPTELLAKADATRRTVRIGGLVVEGSLETYSRDDGAPTVRFDVTDLIHTVPVVYKGPLPDLFREGQGVVVQGRLGPEGVFAADEVLAKHDEKYMPREVADALKQTGVWQGGDGP